MFLEQFIDFLCWCVQWLIIEMRCPSIQRHEGRQPNDGQEDNENINLLPTTPTSDWFCTKSDCIDALIGQKRNFSLFAPFMLPETLPL